MAYSNFETYHSNNAIEDTVVYLKYNPETKDYESTEVQIKKPNNEMVYLVGQDLDYLNEMNIKDFNYIIFEEDIERLDDEEFEYFWKEFFEEWLGAINDTFLYINLDKFKFQLSSTLEKKFLVKKIVHFIMMYLPYNVISDVIKYHITIDIEHKQQLIDYLEEMRETTPSFLKTSIIGSIDKSSQRIKNLFESLNSMVKFSKKGTLENSISLVEDQLSKQELYLTLFKELANNTDNDNLYNLVMLYIDNDFENLI